MRGGGGGLSGRVSDSGVRGGGGGGSVVTSGSASDSAARGPGFKPHDRRVMSLSKTL